MITLSSKRCVNKPLIKWIKDRYFTKDLENIFAFDTKVLDF